MAVFRIEHNSNYTVMSNYHLKEKDMSLKAKGLLSLMLSLPDSWDYSIAGLVNICKENETAIKSTLKELCEFGYIRIDKIYPDKTDTGRIEYIYNVFEQAKQATEKQEVENLPVEFLEVEKKAQLNTNELNTKKINTKEKKSASPGKSSKKQKIFSHIEQKCLEYDLTEEIIELLEQFYEVLIDNNRLVSNQKIEADLSNLARVSVQKQKDTIRTALNRGWQSLNPDWLSPGNNSRINHNCNSMTQEEHLENLSHMKQNSKYTF